MAKISISLMLIKVFAFLSLIVINSFVSSFETFPPSSSPTFSPTTTLEGLSLNDVLIVTIFCTFVVNLCVYCIAYMCLLRGHIAKREEEIIQRERESTAIRENASFSARRSEML